MTRCPDCLLARSSSEYRRFNPLCLWCGARYHRTVGCMSRERKSQKAIDRWQEHILLTWEDYGHHRDELLELALNGPVPYAPVRKGEQ